MTGMVRTTVAATKREEEEENDLCRPRVPGGRGGGDGIQSLSSMMTTMMVGERRGIKGKLARIVRKCKMNREDIKRI